MRKIILRGYAKTVGTDFAEAALFDDDTPDCVIDEAAWHAAIANAEMYGYYYTGDDCIYDSEEDDVWDRYISDSEMGYYWEEYNGEEHDGIRMGGGSFEEDFERLAQ